MRAGLLNRGFTLIEMTAVFALVAILASITLPRAGRLVDVIEIRGAVAEIDAMFSAARHIAITHAQPAVVEIDGGRGTVAIRLGTEPMQSRAVGAAHRVELWSNRSSVTYSPTGMAYGAANLTMIVSRNSSADTIYVSRLGRLRH